MIPEMDVISFGAYQKNLLIFPAQEEGVVGIRRRFPKNS